MTTTVRVVLDPVGVARIHGIAREDVGRVTDAVCEDAKRACPMDTGELEGSIHAEHQDETGRVWVGTDHWAPTEFGSQPHEIRSTGPWPLRNKETGEVFGPLVHHPGTPAQPFMRPAVYQRRSIA